MRRALILAVLACAACRTESFERNVRLQVPQADTRGLPPSLLSVRKVVAVQHGSKPRVLRPHHTVTVLVPVDQPLPRRMRSR